jgi:dolichol-phosphate mannosyltransferase
MISIIIPIFNEEFNIYPLCEKLNADLSSLKNDFEVIIINDGSTDGSEIILAEIAKKFNYKIINFRRNFGQTAALVAGFDYSKGKIIIPMDGDLQNDSADIRILLEKIDEGFDVVSGWRKNRQDYLIKRKLLSKIANKFISFISGVTLHDYGCSLKAYKREIIQEINLYGEMHRFIPIYAKIAGAKITEVEVNHHKRFKGVSKYGLERIIKVILDLFIAKFFIKYSNKPIYIFGTFGMLFLFLSFISFLIASYLKIYHNISFILTPLPLVSVIFFSIGIMTILIGILAEVTMRTYYETQKKKIYLIKSTLNTEIKD